MEYLYLLLRVLVIFLVIMAIIRILGKREVGELSIFDLVVILMIADIGSFGIDEKEKFLMSLICLVLLFVLQKIFSILMIKVAKLRSFFEGNPTIIVQNGLINMEAMKKELYTVDDLITQIRERDVMDVSEVSLAVLETNGTLSVFRKERYNKTRLPLIMSGVICKENLDYFELQENQIQNFLKKHHLNLDKIIYASYDTEDLYYYENKNNKKLLSLKKVSWPKQNQHKVEN